MLTAADPAAKVADTLAAVRAWRDGALGPPVARQDLPERPARPARPELRPPRDMPRRRPGGTAGRIALVHALAHIELNAIDLAWDAVARFGPDLPRGFTDDWVTVAEDEARHFDLLARRLGELGASYGDLPAHDGLWQAAAETAHDVLARMAVVPMVLEARGLDVTPATIANLERLGDGATAEILAVILEDEVGHVAAGRRWFGHVCAERGLAPVATWHDLLRRHFRGVLKPPFNVELRQRAGFGPEYYGANTGPADSAGPGNS